MTPEVDELGALAAADLFDEPAFSSAGATEVARLGVMRLVVDVLLRPGPTFRRLAEHPGRSWLVPLMAFVLLSTALALVVALSPQTGEITRARITSQMSQASAEISEEQRAQVAEFSASGAMRAFAVVSALLGGLVGSLLGLLVVTALFHLLGTVMGGQQSFTQTLTVTAWAGLPLILGLVVKLVAALLGTVDPSPAGLSGLVVDPVSGASSLLAPVLSQVELWHLWSLALYVLAVRAVARISLGKAVFAVAVLVGLQVASGMVGVFVSQAFRGMSGG